MITCGQADSVLQAARSKAEEFGIAVRHILSPKWKFTTPPASSPTPSNLRQRLSHSAAALSPSAHLSFRLRASKRQQPAPRLLSFLAHRQGATGSRRPCTGRLLLSDKGRHTRAPFPFPGFQFPRPNPPELLDCLATHLTQNRTTRGGLDNESAWVGSPEVACHAIIVSRAIITYALTLSKTNRL
jgi:hypothetical protein